MTDHLEDPLRIVAICGSLRRHSYNRGLVRAAIEEAPDGVEIVPLEGLEDVPLLNDDDRETDGLPDAVASAMEQVAAADAVLIATPEYCYGMSGVLKNLLDWLSFPPPTNVMRFKPTAIMGASIGNMGTVRAQLGVRQALLFHDAAVLSKPEVYVSHAPAKFDAEGNLLDEASRSLVCQLVTELRDFARAGAGRQLTHDRPFLFT